MGQRPPGIAAGHPQSHPSKRQAASVDLLPLDTDKFIGHLEERLATGTRGKRRGQRGRACMIRDGVTGAQAIS